MTRTATDEELTKLSAFLKAQRTRFAEDPKAAADLADVATPSQDLDALEPSAKSDLANQAAWTALARVILNLDETISKE